MYFNRIALYASTTQQTPNEHAELTTISSRNNQLFLSVCPADGSSDVTIYITVRGTSLHTDINYDLMVTTKNVLWMYRPLGSFSPYELGPILAGSTHVSFTKPLENVDTNVYECNSAWKLSCGYHYHVSPFTKKPFWPPTTLLSASNYDIFFINATLVNPEIPLYPDEPYPSTKKFISRKSKFRKIFKNSF